MVNLLKNIVPELIMVLATLIAIVAQVINFTVGILTFLSVKLHILLNTSKGLRYVELEKKIKEATAAANLLKAQIKAAMLQQNENNKLANAVKTVSTSVEQPSNIIELGKKKNDPTEPKS